MKIIYLILFLTAFLQTGLPQSEKITQLSSGEISFVSNAPLEIIKAKSNELSGLIDLETNRLAFSIKISTLQGFNSPLQREHFNENYMETSRYPTASFSAKIIENIDLSKVGTYEVRTKGYLSIHGIKKERIIKGTIQVDENEIRINSSFSVPLEDHEITIPRIVYQKIAEEILVNVIAKFEKTR